MVREGLVSAQALSSVMPLGLALPLHEAIEQCTHTQQLLHTHRYEIASDTSDRECGGRYVARKVSLDRAISQIELDMAIDIAATPHRTEGSVLTTEPPSSSNQGCPLSLLLV